jgi:hypothetical protein
MGNFISVGSGAVSIGGSDRSDVADLISRFQRAFDRHDWDGLEACLAPQVQVDYRALRRSPAGPQSASEYCAARRAALDHLDLQHDHSHLVVSAGDSPDRIEARCHFQILRFERSGPRHFHTYGTYEFGVERSGRGDLRIFAISQEVLRNTGDPDIHLGMAQGDGQGMPGPGAGPHSPL